MSLRRGTQAKLVPAAAVTGNKPAEHKPSTGGVKTIRKLEKLTTPVIPARLACIETHVPSAEIFELGSESEEKFRILLL